MNDDHADALLDYCRAVGGLDPSSGELTGVDRYGMDVLATVGEADKRSVRVAFTERADTTDAVRKQTIALLLEARARLGD
jgi:putative heme iron utilization protein